MRKEIGLIAIIFLAIALMAVPAQAIDLEDFWYQGANTTDFGKNSFNLTAGATTAYQPGKLGQAFYFDGLASSHLNHASDALYNLGDNFSISFWLYASADNLYHMPVSREDTGGWQVETGDASLNNHASLYQGGYSVAGTSNVTNSTWNFIMVQRETGNNSKIYVNNVLQTTTADSKSYNEAKTFRIGVGRAGTFYPMKTGSLIDDVRIYTNIFLNSTHRDTLWNNGNGYNYSLNYSAPTTAFTINLTAPNGIYHNMTVNISGFVVGSNATYLCSYSVNGTNSSGFYVNNYTNFTTAMPALYNGTHSLFFNCTDGTNAYNTTITFYIDIGKVDLITWNDATGNYTTANQTQILVYNSSGSVNFTGNNFSWGYNSLPGGNITIIAFFNNITREVSLINNATNYINVTLSFPALTGNYYFLIHNIYNNPIESALVTFSELDGTMITQRYSQSDGYVYDIFLTLNIPVTVTIQKTGYITKNITFTPYITTILPVRIRIDEFIGNGTEYIPFDNVSYSCSPDQIIVDNSTLITCLLQESNSQLLTSVMRVYYINYSGSYLSKTTTCINPASCSFTFTTNKTGSKFRLNLTMNLTYGNYTTYRDYVTNATADFDLPGSTDLGLGVWQFIFFVIMLIIVAIVWGYFGPAALLIIPIIFGIGVMYHVFELGQFILLLLVVFLIFMKLV